MSSGITITGGASGEFSSGGRTTWVSDDGVVTMTGISGFLVASSSMRSEAAASPETATAAAMPEEGDGLYPRSCDGSRMSDLKTSLGRLFFFGGEIRGGGSAKAGIAIESTVRTRTFFGFIAIPFC